MSTADTDVRAWTDTHTNKPAAAALEAMGLSISDAIRLLMVRVAGGASTSVRDQGAECTHLEGNGKA